MNKLYLIPTPIGNLGDITYRAVEILKNADIILAEDTRNSKVLLNHYNIEKPLFAHHKFNEHKTVFQIIQRIQAGEIIAFISDAGTPSISDPGFLLTRNCIDAGIEIECLPGATALIPALVNSGLPSERFCFEGFLPQKKGRQKKLAALAEEERTMIFYESPYRVLKTLSQFAEIFGNDRQAAVSRELTKFYEETKRGTLEELIKYFEQKTIKGEIVIVVEGLNRNRKKLADENCEE